MKHIIKNRQFENKGIWIFEVELLPENDTEEIALHNVSLYSASTKEREFVDNYLLFQLEDSIGQYSIVDTIEIRNNSHILKIYLD